MFNQDPTIVGIKQLHADLKTIPDRIKEGEEFVVVKNSKPVFKIVAMDAAPKKRFTLKDLANMPELKFNGGKNLSRDIDKILYEK